MSDLNDRAYRHLANSERLISRRDMDTCLRSLERQLRLDRESLERAIGRTRFGVVSRPKERDLSVKHESRHKYISDLKAVNEEIREREERVKSKNREIYQKQQELEKEHILLIDAQDRRNALIQKGR